MVLELERMSSIVNITTRNPIKYSDMFYSDPSCVIVLYSVTPVHTPISEFCPTQHHSIPDSDYRKQLYVDPPP